MGQSNPVVGDLILLAADSTAEMVFVVSSSAVFADSTAEMMLVVSSSAVFNADALSEPPTLCGERSWCCVGGRH